eukprot:7100594-Pyramimonas_sp.AAC.1
MKGVTVYLEQIVRDLNCVNEERLHLSSIMCSQGQFFVTYRRMLMMTSASSSFKKSKSKAMVGHDLGRFSYQYSMGIT